LTIPPSRPAPRGLLAASVLALFASAASDAEASEVGSDTPGYPAAAVGDAAVAGGYASARWAEDWRGYRDPAKRDDPLDRLKFLPLDPEGNVYLTLNGELRLRMNHTGNLSLRNAGSQRQDINRIMGGADLHIGEHLRFYGELAHGGIAGDNIGTPTGTQRNRLVVLQSFAEAKSRVAGLDVGLRYGRQEFTDGSSLLTAQRDNNTIRYTLNGVRAWVRTASLRLDAFDFEPTRFGTDGTGDDVSEKAQRFSGVTAGLRLPTRALGGSKLYLDPFFWRMRTRDIAWGGISGREERYYTGARLWGEAGPWTVDWTVDHQSGRFDGRAIDAWQIFLAQTYALRGLPMAPRIGVHLDHASGGGTYSGGTLKAAMTPHGNNVYFSYQLALTPTNLQTIAPNFAFAPVKSVRASVEYQFAWRPDARDAVYRANRSVYVGTQNVPGHKVGESVRAQVVWSITPRVSFTGRYEHLEAGPVLTRAGFGDSDFFAGWLNLRF
jgi:hypothetical protein